MDILAIHPYRPTPTGSSRGAFADCSEITGFVDEIEGCKQLVRRYGPPKPIWLTEIGMKSHNYGAHQGSATEQQALEAAEEPGGPAPEGVLGCSPVEQANYAVRMYVQALSCGVAKVFWYCFGHDPGGWTFTPAEGVVNANTELPRPIFAAYRTMSDELEGADYLRQLDLGDAASYAYLFEKQGRQILVAWTVEGSVLATMGIGRGKVSRVDLMGNRRKLRMKDSSANLVLTESPLFLEASSKRGRFEVSIVRLELSLDAVPEKPFPDIRSGGERRLSVRLRNVPGHPLRGNVGLALPPGWKSSPKERQFVLGKISESVRFTLSVPADAELGAYGVTACVDLELASMQTSISSALKVWAGDLEKVENRVLNSSFEQAGGELPAHCSFFSGSDVTPEFVWSREHHWGSKAAKLVYHVKEVEGNSPSVNAGHSFLVLRFAEPLEAGRYTALWWNKQDGDCVTSLQIYQQDERGAWTWFGGDLAPSKTRRDEFALVYAGFSVPENHSANGIRFVQKGAAEGATALFDDVWVIRSN